MKNLNRIFAFAILASITGVTSFNLINEALVLDSEIIDANNISTQIRNNGISDVNFSTFGAGFYWPKNTSNTAIYSSGLWITAKINDSIHLSRAYYNSKFKPGYFDFNLQQPMGENNSRYRIYKVSPDVPNGNNEFDSWELWPVDLGAPWVDANHNGLYKPPGDYPLMKGTQNFYYSMTDGYGDTGVNATPPLRAEIHYYGWAKENPSCADAIHNEWKIINKHLLPWNDMSVAYWSDIDIGTATNDLGGTDSVLNLVYGYNGTNNDPIYGAAPPAVGFVVKDASRHPGVNKSDYATRLQCGGDCPGNAVSTFRIMHGLRNNGNQWINHITNTPTNYPFSGNPETQTGWRDSMPGDRYVIIGSMFGNVASRDTITFSTVTFIKRGSNNLNSVSQIKGCVNSVIGIQTISENIPESFVLSQNYPNPFNPNTKIKFSIPNTEAGQVKLVVYNSIGKEVATLVNEKLNAGTYEADFDGSGLSSGVYFYKFIAGDFSETKRMVLVK